MVKSIDDLSMKGKRVFIRCDFNVPMKNGVITDDFRMQSALPTIKKAISSGAKVVLASHLGRPAETGYEEKFTLKPVADHLSELLGQKVIFVKDCIGDEAEATVNAMKDGDVCLLENLRFYKGEAKNDAEFAAKLAKMADLYVNDAFGTSHRDAASMTGVPHVLGQAAAGYLVKKEVEVIGKALENPPRPFVAVLGGAKVSDKIGVIKNLLNLVDVVLIGGAMSYTFMKAQGKEIGSSRFEDKVTDKKGNVKDIQAMAKEILALAESKGKKILFPVDFVAVKGLNFDDRSFAEKIVTEKLEEGWEGVDIGPKTRELYRKELSNAKCTMWNGPMGVFEIPALAEGTLEIAKIFADITGKGAMTIVGGGDSAAAVRQMGFDDKVTHVSTGGGAALEMFEGKVLPAVAILDK